MPKNIPEDNAQSSSLEQKPNRVLMVVISFLGIVAIVALGFISYVILQNSQPSTQNNNSETVKKSTIYGIEVDAGADFVDNFKKVSSLSKLLAATDAAGLTETLRGGPYTVFAPDNDAFNKLPSNTLDNLLKPENKKQLTDILTNHIIAGAYRLEDLQNDQELTTLNGAKLKVVKNNSEIKIGSSKVLVSNVVQKNGVAYVIDTVLIPETQGVKVSNVGGVSVSSEKDFAENLALIPTLSTVAAAVEAGGLSSTIKNEGPFTIFVPTNSAFSKLPSGVTVENLLKPENRSQLISILTYHVIPGKLMATDLKDGDEITTLSGAKLKVKISGSKVSLTGGTAGNVVNVEVADVLQKNGVAHIIDGVLLPPAV